MLILALTQPDLDVRAITTVAGNVPLTLTCRNARMITDLMARPDLPVHAGCSHPMSRDSVTAEDFHGASGISGIEPFQPQTPIAQGHAVKAIIAHARAVGPSSLTLVVTGPMTNIAYALNIAPDIHANIKELIVMGGADAAGGNITPTAEFNIFADPHAAKIVFDAELPTRVLSLDVTHQVRAEDVHLSKIDAVQSPHAKLMLNLLDAANQLEARWKEGQRAPMHDPSTLIALLASNLFEGRRGKVCINVQSGDHFGQTTFKPQLDGPHFWYDSVQEDAFFEAIAKRVTPS